MALIVNKYIAMCVNVVNRPVFTQLVFTQLVVTACYQVMQKFQSNYYTKNLLMRCYRQTLWKRYSLCVSCACIYLLVNHIQMYKHFFFKVRHSNTIRSIVPSKECKVSPLTINYLIFTYLSLPGCSVILRSRCLLNSASIWRPSLSQPVESYSDQDRYVKLAL